MTPALIRCRPRLNAGVHGGGLKEINARAFIQGNTAYFFNSFYSCSDIYIVLQFIISNFTPVESYYNFLYNYI